MSTAQGCKRLAQALDSTHAAEMEDAEVPPDGGRHSGERTGAPIEREGERRGPAAGARRGSARDSGSARGDSFA